MLANLIYINGFSLIFPLILFSYEPDSDETKVMGNHLTKHGDGVKV